ncbi:choice-of-anchor I domain-containing protein [Tenacibaculum sp. MEBiC06402]|uniref:choice-of-anchor I domain-containing protein n=1 Tax=unclassified Tenacibaculum TaxID=2635139 RepID=UPI003B9BB95F
MKILFKTLSLLLVTTLFSCKDDNSGITPINTEVNFQYVNTINVGGEGAAEISAYESKTQKLFVVNSEAKEISVYDLKDIDAPVKTGSIPVMSGAPNSISTYEGKVAVALEDAVKQNDGRIALYNAENNTLISSYTVGALPDMVTFSKDEKLIICANEGEPNSLYTNDPEGSISIITVETGNVTTLNFAAFNSQEASLESSGFRVFGPNADLTKDIEPEYIAVSDDSKTAWVSLQENNGLAKSKLSYKNYRRNISFRI